MFHTDLLTPYQETEMHGENYSRPAPELIDDQEEYIVEHIIDSRCHGRRHKLQYLVKWEGYPDSDNQWIGKDDIFADEAIWEFKLQNPCKEVHIRGPPRATLSSSPSSTSPILSRHMYSSTAQYALYNASNTATAPSTFSTTGKDVVISKPDANDFIITNTSEVLEANTPQELAEILMHFPPRKQAMVTNDS